MRVDKWEFTWEFSQLSLLDQTRTRVAWKLTSESWHESFLNFHCLIKREQELHESWQARVYMRVFSTFIAWSNENKSCMKVDKRELTWEFAQLSLLDQTRTRVAWQATTLTSESLHESFLKFIKSPQARNETNTCNIMTYAQICLPYLHRAVLRHPLHFQNVSCNRVQHTEDFYRPSQRSSRNTSPYSCIRLRLPNRQYFH